MMFLTFLGFESFHTVFQFKRVLYSSVFKRNLLVKFSHERCKKTRHKHDKDLKLTPLLEAKYYHFLPGSVVKWLRDVELIIKGCQVRSLCKHFDSENC